jgi:hypothetical protein
VSGDPRAQLGGPDSDDGGVHPPLTFAVASSLLTDATALNKASGVVTFRATLVIDVESLTISFTF